MRIISTAAAIAALIVLASQPAAWAQYSRSSSATRSTGGMSPYGSSRGMSPSGLGSSFGSSGFGTSGFGTSGFGTSGFGTSGFGSSSGLGGRQSSMGGSGLFGSSGTFGTGTQQSGGFIGVDTQDVRNVMQTMGGSPNSTQSSRTTRTGLTQPGTTRRSTQGYSTQNQPGRSSTRSAYGSGQSQIRTVVRVGFDYTPSPPAQLGSTVAARLEDCARIQLHSPVEVSMEGTTAVLRGVVATEHDRVMAEQLARLEPGIWKVQNELTVAPPPAAPAEEPEEEPENR